MSIEREVQKLLENYKIDPNIKSMKIKSSSKTFKKIKQFIQHPNYEQYCDALNINSTTFKNNSNDVQSFDYNVWIVVESLFGKTEHEKIIRYHYDHFKDVVKDYQARTGFSKKEIVDYLSQYTNAQRQLINNNANAALKNSRLITNSVEENMVLPLLEGFKEIKDEYHENLDNCAFIFKHGRKNNLATYLTNQDLVNPINDFLSSNLATELGININELAPRSLRRKSAHYSIRELMTLNQKPRLEETLKELGLTVHYHTKKMGNDFAKEVYQIISN